MDAVFARHGVLRTAAVGRAALTNVRIHDVVTITRQCLTEDPYYLLGDACRPAAV